MGKKPQKPTHEDVMRVYKIFAKHYPNSKTELTHNTHFQLLVGVILSAQCTDDRVNKTTPALFAKYPTAEKMAKASQPTVAKLVHSCGFYQQKSKAIIKTAKSLVSTFGGKIPDTIDDLITLDGVGRKTVSVMLNQAFNKPAIAVDTHVKRVARKLGWAFETDPVKIEFELRELIPEKYWTHINGRLIYHGRKICKARKPLCGECPVSKLCPGSEL